MSHAKDEFMDIREWEMSQDVKLAIPTSMEEPTEWVYGFHLYTLLHSLLDRSTYEGRAREGIESDINDMSSMTEHKYGLIYTVLQNAQIEPVSNGCYSQKDLIRYQKRFK